MRYFHAQSASKCWDRSASHSFEWHWTLDMHTCARSYKCRRMHPCINSHLYRCIYMYLQYFDIFYNYLHTWLDALHLSRLYAFTILYISSHMKTFMDRIDTMDTDTLFVILNFSKRWQGLGLMRKSKLGLLHVNATCKKVGGDQNTGRTRAEFSHDKITLLTLPKHL